MKSFNGKVLFLDRSDINTDEIIDFVELTKHKNIAVRFIEEMPFNGIGQKNVHEVWDYHRILQSIERKYEHIDKLVDKKSSTSRNFKIDHYQGTFGIIPAFTRSICGDCDRIRITATGLFKNCLFDEGVFNIRDFIRDGANDEDLKNIFLSIIQKKPKDGFIAEQQRDSDVTESMSTIGG